MLHLFNKQITDAESVKKDTRPMSTHINNEKINILIDESQTQDIKNALGDNFFIVLMEYVNRSSEEHENIYYETLLNGGIYENCGKRFQFDGLRQALNYFVYARYVKSGEGFATVAGFVQKQLEYSDRSNSDLKRAEYKEAFSIAEKHTNDCLRYIKHHCKHFSEWSKQYIKAVRGPVITKIGD